MPVAIKIVVICLMILIVFSLGSALYYLIKDKDNSDATVKALTWRIGLSLILFLFLIFAFYMGWIVPHQIL